MSLQDRTSIRRVNYIPLTLQSIITNEGGTQMMYEYNNPILILDKQFIDIIVQNLDHSGRYKIRRSEDDLTKEGRLIKICFERKDYKIWFDYESFFKMGKPLKIQEISLYRKFEE